MVDIPRDTPPGSGRPGQSRRRLLLLALAGVGLLLAAWLAFTVFLVGSTLEPVQREALTALLAPRLPLVGMSWLIVLVLLALLLQGVVRRYLLAPARLLEQTRVLLAADTPQQIDPAQVPGLQALAQAVNDLARQRDGLRQDIVQRVEQASRHLQQERNRLAALLSELTQSVVVCNLDGRIVLYNNRARMQFRTLSQAPTLADGAELIGIGRSIYAVFDRQMVAHALEALELRLARGAATPTAQFVTTSHAGQLLRVQMAAVRSGDAAAGQGDGISGFVLMLDNVTRIFQEETRRDQAMHAWAEAAQSSLGALRAAADRLAAPELPDAERARSLALVRDEAGDMHRRLNELLQTTARAQKTRWPLEDMLGADLLLAAQRHLQTHSQRPVTVVESPGEVWLRVDSYLVLQALAYMAGRLVEEFGVKFLQLRLRPAQGCVHLDLIWEGHAVSTETVMTWKMDAMNLGGGEGSPLSVRDVVERHGGEMWFERERVRHQAYFRFELPQAQAQEPLAAASAPGDSRPEFYDFDLFQVTDESRALDERPLASLAYTVFDTETTGLNPSEGDEIIQIGAVRVVNGKLLRQECFDQLVDPGRAIPAASIPIHGITQDMVRGKCRITEVLPAFHAFAQDTVLVAHNAAFDMRFLQLKEAATGRVFHQPVLDTLLLSALVHPNQESHRLEAIAARFNINVLGRHTALGDAIVTAEVFLRLIPLLQAMGIHTLRQAREAAQNTYYARIKY